MLPTEKQIAEEKNAPCSSWYITKEKKTNLLKTYGKQQSTKTHTGAFLDHFMKVVCNHRIAFAVSTPWIELLWRFRSKTHTFVPEQISYRQEKHPLPFTCCYATNTVLFPHNSIDKNEYKLFNLKINKTFFVIFVPVL